MFEGTVKPGDTIRMMATGAEFTLVEVGHMGATNLTPCAQLQAGEVGYLTASITVSPGNSSRQLPSTRSKAARSVALRRSTPRL